MATEIHVIVSAAGHSYRAEVDGRHLVTARTPFFAAARVLLGEGADPGTPLAMCWAGSDTVSLRSTVGRAASLTITEDDTGIRLAKYRPGPVDRMAASHVAEPLERPRALAA